MLFIDGKQVGLDELQKELGIKIPIEKVLKKPVFEINPALKQRDPANGPNAYRVRAGYDFPPKFNFRHPKTGRTHEVRYADQMPVPKEATEGRTFSYSPKMLSFEGEMEYVNTDEDKAIFFYLYPVCKDSPCRSAKSPYEWHFVDDEAKANARIESIEKKREAMRFVDTLEGQSLFIIAKALRIPGAHRMDERQVLAEVSDYAMAKPEEFLKKADSQVAQIEGLIIDAIDRGIFVLDKVYNTKQWKWGMGTSKGAMIVELSEHVKDEAEALITHFQSNNLTEMLPKLIEISKTVVAKDTAEKQLAGVDILGQFGAKKPEQDESNEYIPEERPPFPTDMATARDWMKYKTGKKPAPETAKLWREIQAGVVTDDNIDDWFKENI